MKNKYKINAGIEIEVNDTYGLSIDKTLWGVANEHCGYELRSQPCSGHSGIKKLISSIKVMGKSSISMGDIFNNTGTHIHLDFLNDKVGTAIDMDKLQRLQVRKNEDDTWNNPLGTNKRYVWLSPDGTSWKSPKEYLEFHNIPKIKVSDGYYSTGKHVQSVKRFMLLGKRFSDVLFALQHPSRRFNKYCHSIGGWDEDILMSRATVEDICTHPNLLQNHRRHMFNPLAFSKFGTVEVRMIKGTLDYKNIWANFFLFGKMAQLAKSDRDLPNSIGLTSVDLLTLLSYCEIHGKMRRNLCDLFIINSHMKKSSWTSRCFHCECVVNIENIFDYGLSRGYCKTCHSAVSPCIICGYMMDRSNGECIDKRMPDGRYVCNSCKSHSSMSKIKQMEKDGKMMFISGQRIGSGIDTIGPNTLRKISEVFKNNY